LSASCTISAPEEKEMRLGASAAGALVVDAVAVDEVVAVATGLLAAGGAASF
jgi:hypothetical protein